MCSMLMCIPSYSYIAPSCLWFVILSTFLFVVAFDGVLSIVASLYALKANDRRGNNYAIYSTPLKAYIWSVQRLCFSMLELYRTMRRMPTMSYHSAVSHDQI